jgi:hypothetical protein
MTWILQLHSQPRRGVAQPGRAPGSGPGGRRFKSSLPDQSFQSDIRGGAAQAFDHAGISNTGISNTMGARNGRAARVGTSRRKNLGERQSPKFRSLVVQRPTSKYSLFGRNGLDRSFSSGLRVCRTHLTGGQG